MKLAHGALREKDIAREVWAPMPGSLANKAIAKLGLRPVLVPLKEVNKDAVRWHFAWWYTVTWQGRAMK